MSRSRKPTRTVWALAATLATAAGIALTAAVGNGHAALDAFVVLGDVEGTPTYQCNDVTCSSQVIGYSFTGAGICQGTCPGWPVGDAQTILNLNAAKLSSTDQCRIKTGTGSLDLQWPADTAAPEVTGSFSFKARDSHTLSFTGTVATSNAAALPAGSTFHGTVGFPPSPCTGGGSSFQVSFAG